MTPETRLKTAVMKRLKSVPDSAARKLHGSQFAVAGDPDILFWRKIPANLPAQMGIGFSIRVAPTQEELTKALAELQMNEGVYIPANSVREVVCITITESWAIELKVPGNAPTKIQLHRHEELRHAGVNVVVCHSVHEVELALGLYPS